MPDRPQIEARGGTPGPRDLLLLACQTIATLSDRVVDLEAVASGSRVATLEARLAAAEQRIAELEGTPAARRRLIMPGD